MSDPLDRTLQHNLRGQSYISPLSISFHFKSQHLSHIHLRESTEFKVHFKGDCPNKAAIYQWLSSFIEGRPLPFPIALQLETLPPFTNKVLQELLKIPFGIKKSYSDIAKACGNPKAARAVGNACRVNPFPLVIPCHRVIGKNNNLGGFAYGLKMKKQLLNFENSKI